MNKSEFASLQLAVIDNQGCARVCVCGRKRQAGLQALDSKAKLPVQRRAAEPSNKPLHVIWMRLELPAEQSEDPGPVLIERFLLSSCQGWR